MKKLEEVQSLHRSSMMKAKMMLAITHTALMTTTATPMLMRAILVTVITTWKQHTRKMHDVIKGHRQNLQNSKGALMDFPENSCSHVIRLNDHFMYFLYKVLYFFVWGFLNSLVV